MICPRQRFPSASWVKRKIKQAGSGYCIRGLLFVRLGLQSRLLTELCDR